MDDAMTCEWMGYQYRRGERNAYWVTKGGINPMPGACCFSTQDDARRGIAALVITNAILAGIHHDAEARGHVFWSLMELSR